MVSLVSIHGCNQYNISILEVPYKVINMMSSFKGRIKNENLKYSTFTKFNL